MSKLHSHRINTPYLKGGYLAWHVYNKINEKRQQDIMKILSTRPRARIISRMH